MAAPMQQMLLAGSPVFTTWDPANKGAQVTLSNGNLTISFTGTTNYNIVRALIGHSIGAYYWEIKSTSAQNFVGLSNSSAPLTSTTVFLGADVNGWGQGSGGGTWHSNVNSGLGTAYTTNDFLNLAFDATNGRLWVGKNGTWMNGGTTPSTSAATGALFTGISGTIFPTWGSNGTGDVESAIANFGATPFNNTVPAGFTAGWY